MLWEALALLLWKLRIQIISAKCISFTFFLHRLFRTNCCSTIKLVQKWLSCYSGWLATKVVVQHWSDKKSTWVMTLGNIFLCIIKLRQRLEERPRRRTETGWTGNHIVQNHQQNIIWIFFLCQIFLKLILPQKMAKILLFGKKYRIHNFTCFQKINLARFARNVVKWDLFSNLKHCADITKKRQKTTIRKMFHFGIVLPRQ